MRYSRKCLNLQRKPPKPKELTRIQKQLDQSLDEMFSELKDNYGIEKSRFRGHANRNKNKVISHMSE